MDEIEPSFRFFVPYCIMSSFHFITA